MWGVITSLAYLLCAVLCLLTGSDWQHVVMFLINVVFFIVIALLEVPELLPYGFLLVIKDCLGCLSGPYMRFAVYLVFCITYAGSPFGYSFIGPICVTIGMLIYAFIAFFNKGANEENTKPITADV